MSVSLLTTKLFVPPARDNLVLRPRLIERLDAGLRAGCKLILLSAPAGFGKTTLVTEWLKNARAKGHVKATGGEDWAFAWLSLDENDNDPVRFAAYLLSALQEIDPSIGQIARGMLQAPQPSGPDLWLTSLINDLAAVSHPFVLVLDDYHLMRTPAIHQQLAFLLEHQPPDMHLVIATREDPPFPLSRWRARGQTVEVRQADLTFTERETADLVWRMMELDLSPSDIAALQRRTEGWVAGLQLALLSFRGHDDVQHLVQSFAGSHRYILDYLIEEVFQRQTCEVQDFLLKTSILDRFAAPLCDAVRFGTVEPPTCAEGADVAEHSSSYEILLELDQANLFLVPLDQSRQWYRYHHLFAELLRQRLRTVGAPGLASLLHARASQWYEANGFPTDAVQHALSGSDWERAAALLLDLDATMLKRGEVTTLLGWFRALPDEVVRADARLCNAYSWPLLLTDQVDAAEAYLARAEEIVREQDGEDAPFLGVTAVARAHIARARGDGQRAIELSERALVLLPQDKLSERSITALNLGIAQWHRGQLIEAEQALKEAQCAANGSGNDYVRYAALAFLSRAQSAHGKLRRAAATCHRIVEEGGHLPIVALTHYDLCKLYYEWNDLAVAEKHAEQGIDLSRRSASPEFLARGLVALAQIRQARSEPSAALASLQEAARLLEHPGITPVARLHYLAQHTLVKVAQGDLDDAASVVERTPPLDEAGSFPGYLLLMVAQARVFLAQQQHAAAWEQLAVLQEMASRSGWQSVILQAYVLQALAAPTPDEGLDKLGKALTLAEPEGYVRTFVDLGEPMAVLLRQVAAHGIARAYARTLLAAVEAESHDRGSPGQSPRSPAQPLIEPLTERELEVLPLLVEGLTRREIAQVLSVSVNTIKAHLKGIYGKLGVHDRREAVAKARSLDLLS